MKNIADRRDHRKARTEDRATEMPLQDIFREPIEAIRLFMDLPYQSLLSIRVAPDIREVVLRLLMRLDDDPEVPHVMLGSDIAFHDADQFFDDLRAEISEAHAALYAQLTAVGVAVSPGGNLQDDVRPGDKLTGYLTAIADTMPGDGALVLILEPKEVADRDSFQLAMQWLTEHTHSERVKYIVIERKDEPWLGDIHLRTGRAAVQVFHFAPKDIEDGVTADLQSSRALPPLDRRQYTALLGSFAFARKDYDTALIHQEKWLSMISRDGSPEEIPNALYNLGNTHLAKGDLDQAEEYLVRAVDLCLDHSLNSLLPLALTNLGVCLYRQDRLPEAIESFQVARDTSSALGHRVAEATVLDNLAMAHASAGHHDDAERCWIETLQIYDGVTSDAFRDVRDAGRKDVLEKLKRHYKETGQSDKLAKIERSGEDSGHG